MEIFLLLLFVTLVAIARLYIIVFGVTPRVTAIKGLLSNEEHCRHVISMWELTAASRRHDERANATRATVADARLLLDQVHELCLVAQNHRLKAWRLLRRAGRTLDRVDELLGIETRRIL